MASTDGGGDGMNPGTVHTIDEARRRAELGQRYAAEGFGAGFDQGEMFARGPVISVDCSEWTEGDIPVRPWIAHGYALRGHLTVLSGPGAGGKSMVALGWAIALALGRSFHRFRVTAPCRCLVYNVEDDGDEQRRRMSAALRQFDASPHDLGDRVMRVTPKRAGTLVHRDRDFGATRDTEVLRAIEQLIDQHKPEVVILDPFIETHDSDENDNNAIRAVLAHLRAIATQRNVAVILLHHARKGSTASPGDPDTLRGASAIASAARIVLTLTVMTEEEADTFGIERARRLDYFRLDGAKMNHSPAGAAEWFHRIAYPLDNGELVAAAVPWIPPGMWDGITADELNRALDAIAAGPGGGVLYSRTRRKGGARWVGQALMERLGVDEMKATAMIGTWFHSGLLSETEYDHPEQRKPRLGVIVNAARRPS